MSADVAQPKILIVEDKQDNIDLISYFLKPQNYEISVAMDGESAIEKIANDPPDIILLDIMLPKMNGFEVCERIKKNPETRFIPVIMITALKELKDKIHSLEVGADDFITKPFENVELLTRVKSLLRLKKYHDELEQKNKELLRMDQFKDELSHLIVHDMKNPIFVIQGNLQMMSMGLSDPASSVLKKYVDRIDRSTQNLLRMVMNLIDIAKIESGQMKLNKELIKVNDVIEKCVQKVCEYPENNTKKVTLSLSKEVPFTYVDNSVLERVMENIITFAVSNINTDGEVNINTSFNDNIVNCEIKDDGIQIPPKYQHSVFEKYSQIEIKNEGYRVGRGLSFTYSKIAVEAHKGKLYLDNSSSTGNKFIINLPKENPVAAQQ
ncbi:MAG: hybrid sensor histidine kinase/response regulator [Calditrichaeota bacterium]|nr:MAG: response regulator [Calditrichota bacterium]MBL1203897.1 hybrid sensor histidine kinase/response regulator [Calditrichota bacterium]NOG43729.1 response regulator [Calditrichota bacterium]